MELGRTDHRGFRPAGWIEAGLERLQLLRPFAEGAGLTPIQLAAQWNLAHPAVECVAPTLIQELGPEATPIEDERADLAALPAEQRLRPRTWRRSGRSATTAAAWPEGANPGHEEPSNRTGGA